MRLIQYRHKVRLSDRSSINLGTLSSSFRCPAQTPLETQRRQGTGDTRRKAQKTTKQMNPPKMVCFAHCHMTPAEYGIYSHLREVSHPHNYQYRFDDRNISERFASGRGTSKDTINRIRRFLAQLGFIEWLEPLRRTGGRYAPRLGRILAHKEWAALNPGRCIHDSISEAQSTADGAVSPVSKEASHQSHQRDSIPYNKSITTNPALSGMAGPDFFSHSPLSDSADRRIHTLSPVSPVIQVTDSPVSPARQVESALGPIVTGLLPSAAAAWRKVVSAMTSDNRPSELIADVLCYYVEQYGADHVRAEGADAFPISFPWLLDEAKQSERGKAK